MAGSGEAGDCRGKRNRLCPVVLDRCSAGHRDGPSRGVSPREDGGHGRYTPRGRRRRWSEDAVAAGAGLIASGPAQRVALVTLPARMHEVHT
jgi:hypothetical protein